MVSWHDFMPCTALQEDLSICIIHSKLNISLVKRTAQLKVPIQQFSAILWSS